MQTEINYNFYTAWSPCCPVVEEMAGQYPNLKFEHAYYEPGCGFAGKDIYENGELVNDEYYDCENRNDYAVGKGEFTHNPDLCAINYIACYYTVNGLEVFE